MMVVLVLGVEAGVTVVAELTMTVPPVRCPEGTMVVVVRPVPCSLTEMEYPGPECGWPEPEPGDPV